MLPIHVGLLRRGDAREFYSENRKGRDHLEVLSMCGNMWIFKKCRVTVWTGFNLLRISFNDELL
jgi:hypothetical protein